ncbi:transglutaminase [Comamonas serinivorans]|uniref:Transglutaminase n=1 Tax=Comamonas serinivorans TaxID=1082851 RepID=A0A1Y0EQB4_9BURK|nr:transglutaminase family protein [Comamonas serinivorans]ARU05766.1 transglutaminase [Comamonas serinivorans]
MLLDVLHDTHYRYQAPVQVAQHQLHLSPRATDQQAVESHHLQVWPVPGDWHLDIDPFGNERRFFTLTEPHDALTLSARSRVRTRPFEARADLDLQLPWEQVRERFVYRGGRADDPASVYLFPSPLVPRGADFEDYARQSFGAGRPLIEAAQALNLRLHEDFVYDGSSTGVETTAAQALAKRRGVCQDFAHVMVACLRSLGLPARYVSGYLLTHPPPGQPRLIGADASHAWVEVYLPSPDPAQATGQWFGHCPTNARTPGEDYVYMACGRDFTDVSPVRGVIQGGQHHELDVAVTVMPLDEAGFGL